MYNWNTGTHLWETAPSAVCKFVWSGWLMLLELDGSVAVPPASDVIVRKYTWGLDLAGLNGGVASGPPRADSTGRPGDGGYRAPPLQAAGGILDTAPPHQGQVGGLLAVQDVDATPGPAGGDGNYLVFCDANGNVGQLVAWSPNVLNGSTPLGTAWHANRLVARYEYDAYGSVIGPDTNQDGDFDASDQPGPYTGENPLRFSTKHFDAETTLGYWGYRYYSPSLGRWMSRDPMGEDGDVGLYRCLRNDPALGLDPLGRESVNFLDEGNPWGEPTRPSVGEEDSGAKILFDTCCGQTQREQIQPRADAACNCLRKAYRIMSSRDELDAAIRRCPRTYPLSKWRIAPENDGFPEPEKEKIRAQFAAKLRRAAIGCTDGFGVECETDCSDKPDNDGGYVYALGGDVHLCPVYWTKPAEGQEGVFIHELSHKFSGTVDGSTGFLENAEDFKRAVRGLCSCPAAAPTSQPGG